jgi:5-methylcytosine-specific restriction endonuclease McrA
MNITYRNDVIIKIPAMFEHPGIRPNLYWRLDMDILAHKKCGKCGEVKSASEYYKNPRNKDGLYGVCKACWNSKSKDHYQKNKELANRRASQWRVNNLEKARASVSKYLSSIKGKLMRARNNTETKKEKGRIRALKSAHANPERHRETTKLWRINNKDKYRHNKIVRYGREKGAEGKYSLKQWYSVLSYYTPNGECLACGKVSKLHRDHVVPLVKGGTNYIGNIQPLCRDCNSRKRDKTIDYRPDKGDYARSIQNG